MKKGFTVHFSLIGLLNFKKLFFLIVGLALSTAGFPQLLKVNFQDPKTVPPTGWVRDYGQAYGLRTGSYQGNQRTYGWKKRSDNSLLNLSVGGSTPGNGRNRKMPSDPLQATLIHMQADDIAGTFDGTKAEGYWEAKLTKGIYDVVVSAGDAGVYSFPEKHTLNVEGVQAIKDFVPTGAAGSSTRFKSATVRVAVTDGNLTINADGGVNTKINSVRIVPYSTGPFTYWSANEQQLSVQKTSSATTKTFSLDLSNSSNKSVQYTLSATYGTGASGWLSFNRTHSGTEPNVTINYTATQNLPLGTYKATVYAAAAGFTAGSVTVKVTVSAPRPYVISSTPANKATNVSVNTSSIAANNLFVPTVAGYKGGVDNSTITSSTVKLLKVVGTSTTQIQGVVQGTGGGDAISFSPTFALEPNATYKFVITDGVKSYSKASFIPYTATFTTGAALESRDPISVEFTKVAIPGTQKKKYSSLVIGPDSKFYALRLDGAIERFTINRTTGMLGNQSVISTALSGKYGSRAAVGLVFDPASTASNLIAYVSHCSGKLEGAPAFDGKISKLTGANLTTERLLVTNLPRSTKDHLVNSLAFGPDKALYISQGSNSSMGAYDGSWQRTESLLSGSILRLDLVKLGSATLDAKTTTNQSVINAASGTSAKMSDGTYNPYSSASPLTIYASGVRNAYDLVWHSNGQLYSPANGSAAGGNTPASLSGTRRPDGSKYSGPSIPATSGVQVQNDWLFRIKKGGYYGHPNPLRGEYVANRGYKDNSKYASTVVADPNYRGAAFNFNLNRSPNGAIEYKSNAFNGALKGKILVCRFSGGGDIIVLKPGSVVKGSTDGQYNITDNYTGAGTNGLVGMSGFINPLDLVEDPQTGNLYVIEFNWNNIPDRTSQITLLRVSNISDADGYASAYPQKISATEVVGVSNILNSVQNLTSPLLAGTAKKDKKEKEDKGKGKGKDKDDDDDDDDQDNGKGDDGNNDDDDLLDFSRVTRHAVTISNTGRGNLMLKNLEITGPNASEFKILDQPNVNPNKPIKIRKNSSITFNVAFYPKSIGLKHAKLEAVNNKKKKGQFVSVDLVGLGITYEGIDSVLGGLLDSATNIVVDVTKPLLNPDKLKLNVYPNPNEVGSKIYFDLAGFNANEPVTLNLYDSFGQLYQAKTIQVDEQGRSSAEMPVSTTMNPGIYILRATGAAGQKESRIILK
ncbi:PQQ-dependent sugar dehydrogenase [Adhaeribacter swui]|uniref:PQQ-dependent sugar dehydrogenase n=1 Tax=Adhaeribacter swui TaxID=2086471 RepID=A0A7G7GBR8_9BACT|nr:Ig-like domain-containing protein [Adhaeribacter swui]QNF34602.1 PQQ-dependent sugar dehydrogenase [Adhaeribacter swui]